MTTRSSAGWLILVAALAVPGFMFYSWWSHVNTESKKQLEIKVRTRLPEGGPFAGTPDKNKLTNPISVVPAAKGVEPSSATAAIGAGALKPATTASVTPPVPGPATAAAGAEAAVSRSSAPAPAPAPAAVAAGAAAVFIARDPTLSPYDIVRQQQLELEGQLRQQELQREIHKKKPVKKEPPPETLIDLQGIVSNPDSGNKAIVNGEMVGEGDFAGEIKVVKITSQGVVFAFKGKRFTKTINK